MLRKKATFILPGSLLDDIHQAVACGQAASASALVREAIESHVRVLRERQIQLQMSRAAADPEFLADLEETMQQFALLDAETARLIPE